MPIYSNLSNSYGGLNMYISTLASKVRILRHVEVHKQVPARHTRIALVSFACDPEAYTRVDASRD